MPVAELCRKHVMSDASFYTWKAKYGGLDVSEAKRLRARQAGRHPQRQRHGTDLQRRPGLVGPNRRPMALCRPRQAAAERLHRELQRPHAGRGAERDLVPPARPCARRAGRMASRLQRAEAALEARLDDALHLHCDPLRHCRPDRSATGKLRGRALRRHQRWDQINRRLQFGLDKKRRSRHLP